MVCFEEWDIQTNRPTVNKFLCIGQSFHDAVYAFLIFCLHRWEKISHSVLYDETNIVLIINNTHAYRIYVGPLNVEMLEYVKFNFN